jgi:arginine N-succinyltransferase
MARARYLFIARHRAWFGDRVIAELRGWQDAGGRAPVWEAIGRRFYDMEFADADRHGAIAGNQFIADLGPRYPIYISMLPADAQEALGRPHDDGRAAHAMLLDEGFVDDGYVDIFDGGPTLVARIDNVRTISAARWATLANVAPGGEPALVATGEGAAFRVAAGLAGWSTTGDLAIEAGLAQALQVAPGAELLVAS